LPRRPHRRQLRSRRLKSNGAHEMQNPLKRLVGGGAQLCPFNGEALEARLKADNELWTELSSKSAEFKNYRIDAGLPFRSVSVVAVG
jgi:hypothetical protein